MKLYSLPEFLSVLFEPHEHTCFTDSMLGTKVKKYPDQADILFSINAINPHEDAGYMESVTRKQYRPRRADVNVCSFRNFLIEMDDMELEKQIGVVSEKLPVSTIVYSGSKSYHFIVSLETPLPNLAEYKKLSKKLNEYIKGADPTTKNPSRLSRLPFRTRPETNLAQSLYYLGSRIPNQKILDLLPKDDPVVFIRDYTKDSTRKFVATEILEAVKYPERTMNEKNIIGRNNFFFWLGNRIKDLQYDKELAEHYISSAYENLQNKQDFTLQEALFAARLNN